MQKRELAEYQNGLAAEMLGTNGNDGPAHTFARNLVKRRRDLVEIANDAAADAVIWAIDKYDPERHRSFRGIALKAVKCTVDARVKDCYKQRTARGDQGNLGDLAGEVAERPRIEGWSEPERLALLTPDEFRAVLLFAVGDYTKAEIATVMTNQRRSMSERQVGRRLESGARKYFRLDAAA